MCSRVLAERDITLHFSCIVQPRGEFFETHSFVCVCYGQFGIEREPRGDFPVCVLHDDPNFLRAM